MKPKFEFSKWIMVFVGITYFWGVIIGSVIVFLDTSQIESLLVYIGAAAGIALGGYAGKSALENKHKIAHQMQIELEKLKTTEGPLKDVAEGIQEDLVDELKETE